MSDVPSSSVDIDIGWYAPKFYTKYYDPNDESSTDRVTNQWNISEYDCNDRWSTLSIVRVNLNDNCLVKVSYCDTTWYLKLKSDCLRQKQLDQIMARLSLKYEVPNIKKVIIRGFRSDVKTDQIPYFRQICVDEHLGTFLDRFENLKYLELELVFLSPYFMDTILNYSFMHQIESFFVPDMYVLDWRHGEAFVGNNIKVLHMFEKTFCKLNRNNLNWMISRPINVVIHKEKESFNHNNREYYRYVKARLKNRERYFEVPYCNKSDRELHLDREVNPSFRSFQNITTFKLFRLKECGDENVIMKSISNIRNFGNLRYLKIDGFFDKNHFRRLLMALKNCRVLTHLILKIGNLNEDDWIYLIKRLPKHILCIRLDGLSSYKVIAALKSRCSKTLRNLEIKVRETRLSIQSIKLIFTEFTRLHYLKLDGIHRENCGLFSCLCLQYMKIPTVEYSVQNNYPGSLYESSTPMHKLRAPFFDACTNFTHSR